MLMIIIIFTLNYNLGLSLHIYRKYFQNLVFIYSIAQIGKTFQEGV